MRNSLYLALPAVLLLGCIEPLSVEPEQAQPELAVQETRRIELRYLRFDVEGAAGGSGPRARPPTG